MGETMKRRDFLKGSVAGAATAAVASPAVAQSAPEVKWRMVSSFPKQLDVLHGGAEFFAKQVADLTDNKFQIAVLAPGEPVAALQALDAAGSGSVDAAYSSAHYFVGKDPTYSIFASVPFGLNARMQNSWLSQGGGNELANQLFAKANLVGFPCGNTGTQMGGWFRAELKSTADLAGLKFRIGGIAGQVLQKLGVVPQQVAGGDVAAMLKSGALDATEWIGPHDDEKRDFAKVAPYYYYPAFWEGGPTIHAFFNLQKYNGLPKTYQAALANAAANANAWVLARYDMLNPAAMKRLVTAGVQFRPFPDEVLEAALAATRELWAELSAGNAEFKKAIEAMLAFRSDQYLWWRVAEYTNDTFMIRSRTRG
jgi:TRAP-type mannitol/chloroaromatic compound transport system substrate-binding protein